MLANVCEYKIKLVHATEWLKKGKAAQSSLKFKVHCLLCQ